MTKPSAQVTLTRECWRPPQFLDDRLPERFWIKAIPEPNGGCWLWLGAAANGYGRFRVGSLLDETRKLVPAHRYAFEMVAGALPHTLEIDHRCRNKLCVNPEHLDLVTRLENARRWSRTITHCPQRHEYTPSNTRLINGGRACRECERQRQRATA